MITKNILPPNSITPSGLNFSSDGSLLMGNQSDFLRIWTTDTYANAFQLKFPNPCLTAVFGRHPLTAIYILVVFQDIFQIQNISGDVCFEEKGALVNVCSAESYPAFVGFLSETHQIIVVSGNFVDIVKPLLFTHSFFSVGTEMPLIPMMAPRKTEFEE